MPDVAGLSTPWERATRALARVEAGDRSADTLEDLRRAVWALQDMQHPKAHALSNAAQVAVLGDDDAPRSGGDGAH